MFMIFILLAPRIKPFGLFFLQEKSSIHMCLQLPACCWHVGLYCRSIYGSWLSLILKICWC